MHELAVAQEILALVQRHILPGQVPLVRAVRVRIGALAGVVPDSLEFCFSAIVTGTPWQDAALVMTHVPAEARCVTCATVFPTQAPGAGCPSCGSPQVRMVHGQELHVDAVDLADDDSEARVPAGEEVAVA
jgi:hydrogenase nickel incorporation protein HypA/HybF